MLSTPLADAFVPLPRDDEDDDDDEDETAERPRRPTVRNDDVDAEAVEKNDGDDVGVPARLMRAEALPLLQRVAISAVMPASSCSGEVVSMSMVELCL